MTDPDPTPAEGRIRRIARFAFTLMASRPNGFWLSSGGDSGRRDGHAPRGPSDPRLPPP